MPFDMTLLLPLIVLLPLMLLIFRQRKAQRAFLEQQERLAVGQEVMTTAGLYGRVVQIDGDVMVLEVAPGYRVRWARAAVGKIVSPSATAPVDTSKRTPPSGA